MGEQRGIRQGLLTAGPARHHEGFERAIDAIEPFGGHQRQSGAAANGPVYWTCQYQFVLRRGTESVCNIESICCAGDFDQNGVVVSDDDDLAHVDNASLRDRWTRFAGFRTLLPRTTHVFGTLVVMTEDVKTIACVLFPGTDPLDLIGPMQALNMLAFLGPGWRTVVVAERIEAYETEGPLRITPSHTFDEVPTPDVLVVPGASTPAFRAMTDETLLNYLRSAAAHAEVIASVCSGSLILGAAGLLEGRKATTHWTAFELLAEFGATPVRQRWVHDGPILTAAGQSAGIDMGLYLVQHLAGAETARLTQFGMEYDPEPPLGPLDWDQPPHDIFDPRAQTWIEDGLTENPELAARLVTRLRADRRLS